MNDQDQTKTEGGGAVASSDLLARVKQLYPKQEGEPFYGPSDYNPLIGSFGEILLQVDDKDYQGDTRVILKRGDEYGLLIFGWGSCSGCDALQACDTYQDIENLRARLESDIKWLPAKELLAYLETHDWKGDYSWHDDGETKQFVEQATAMMRERANEKADRQPPETKP
jgi:hypothetical protein